MLLSLSFLLSNGPAKGVLLAKNEVLSDEGYSGKRQQQLLVADVGAQFEMGEEDRTEEPDGDPDDDGLYWNTFLQLQAWSFDSVHVDVRNNCTVHVAKVPLYILQHSWKFFLEK